MSEGPAERLAKWLDDPEEAGLFTRRDIADLALLLDERKKDTAAVWDLVQSAMEFVLPVTVDRNLSLLYTRFYDRIWERKKKT